MAPRSAFVGAFLLVSTVVGCGSDDTSPTDVTTDSKELNSLWPHDDGLYWVLEGVEQNIPFSAFNPTTYDRLEDVPPFAMTAEEVVEYLSNDPEPALGALEPRGWSLAFDGTWITDTGVTLQRLHQEPTMVNSFVGEATGWQCTEERIELYREDIPGSLPRVLIEIPLQVGHRFSWLNEPTIEVDSFAEVVVIQDLPEGDFVDDDLTGVAYALSSCQRFTSEEGEEAWYRYDIFGLIVFATNVGPVYARERSFPGDFDHPMWDREYVLVETGSLTIQRGR